MARIGTPAVEKESTSETLLETGLSCNAVLVLPDEIETFWPQVKDQLARCTPHSEGELEPEDFKAFLTEGEMQLWLAIDDGELLASMVTQVVTYPRKRILRIIAIGGGEMERWIHFLSGLENWAMEQGCTALECWGRKGWLRVLEDWKCSYHVLTKDLKIRMH